MPLPYVPPPDDVTPPPADPPVTPVAPTALRGLFGELPSPPAFGSALQPLPDADAWTPRVAAPLQQGSPRWYRPNPHALLWSSVWVLPFFALSCGTLLRMDAPAWAYPLVLGGHVVSGALPVAVVAHLSRSRWPWWYYPGGIFLLAALELFVLNLVR